MSNTTDNESDYYIPKSGPYAGIALKLPKARANAVEVTTENSVDAPPPPPEKTSNPPPPRCV